MFKKKKICLYWGITKKRFSFCRGFYQFNKDNPEFRQIITWGTGGAENIYGLYSEIYGSIIRIHSGKSITVHPHATIDTSKVISKGMNYVWQQSYLTV